MNTFKKSLRLVSCISLVSFLSSCAVGPNYENADYGVSHRRGSYARRQSASRYLVA